MSRTLKRCYRLAAKAELARIGRYDAALTRSTGHHTLREHWADLDQCFP